MTEEEREEKAGEIIARLDETLTAYIDNIGADKITPSQFSAALMYTGQKVFNKEYKKVLRDYDRPTVYNNYIYDYKLIDYISNYYIYKAKLYNQVVNINGFSYLVNIRYDVISKWCDQTSEEASPASRLVFQKLTREHEQTLQDAGLFSGRNPVGYIAALNHFFRWNDAPAVQTREEEAQSLEKLPDFSSYRQIAQRQEGQETGENFPGKPEK